MSFNVIELYLFEARCVQNDNEHTQYLCKYILDVILMTNNQMPHNKPITQIIYNINNPLYAYRILVI
jgi:hypothetical protein